MHDKILFSLALSLPLFACDMDDSPEEEPKLCMGITEINGEPVPGELRMLSNVSTMYDDSITRRWRFDPSTTMEIEDDRATRMLVSRGTREVDTRVYIHIHEYGGHTCVLNGEITIYMEGREPATFEAGTCYDMPPNTYMAAYNSGTVDAELIDTFILPPGARHITNCETEG